MKKDNGNLCATRGNINRKEVSKAPVQDLWEAGDKVSGDGKGRVVLVGGWE